MFIDLISWYCSFPLILLVLDEYDTISPHIVAFNVSQSKEGEKLSFSFDSKKSYILLLSIHKKKCLPARLCLVSNEGVSELLKAHVGSSNTGA